MERDPYDVLGVTPDAAAEEIQLAWLAASRRYDPATGTEPDAQRKLEVDDAFETLHDPARRAAVDQQRAASSPPPAAAGAGMPAPPPPPAAAAPGAPGAPSGPPGPPAMGFPGKPGGMMPMAVPGGQTTNTLAWVSVIFLVLCMPAAVVMALIARSQIKASNGRQKGLGLTTFVLVVAGVLIALWLLLVLGSSSNSSY